MISGARGARMRNRRAEKGAGRRTGGRKNDFSRGPSRKTAAATRSPGYLSRVSHRENLFYGSPITRLPRRRLSGAAVRPACEGEVIVAGKSNFQRWPGKTTGSPGWRLVAPLRSAARSRKDDRLRSAFGIGPHRARGIFNDDAPCDPRRSVSVS